MSMRLWLIALVGAATITSGCAKAKKAEGETGRPPVAVDAAVVAAASVDDAIEVVGTLSPKFSAEIKSEFTAVVAEVYVTEWIAVSKGQPLARLDTREGEAEVAGVRAALAQSEVAETRAQRELERAIKLKDVGLITQQGLDDARTAREAAAATTSAARAQLTIAETRLAKSLIRSPMSGVVAYRGVSVGDRVESMGGGPMFRIVDNRLFDLNVQVPSSKSSRLRIGLPLEFTTESIPGRTFSGKVKFINPAVDAADRSVKVIAEVPNDEESLRGGVFVKGRILTGSRDAVIQIPRAALVTLDVASGAGEVLVINGELAERRSVRTGATSGDIVEIIDGLTAGERVITRGGSTLRPGDRVKVASPEGA